jgi:hypothetical protein
VRRRLIKGLPPTTAPLHVETAKKFAALTESRRKEDAASAAAHASMGDSTIGSSSVPPPPIRFSDSHGHQLPAPENVEADPRDGGAEADGLQRLRLRTESSRYRALDARRSREDALKLQPARSASVPPPPAAIHHDRLHHHGRAHFSPVPRRRIMGKQAPPHHPAPSFSHHH